MRFGCKSPGQPVTMQFNTPLPWSWSREGRLPGSLDHEASGSTCSRNEATLYLSGWLPFGRVARIAEYHKRVSLEFVEHVREVAVLHKARC